ncbi:MAG: NYN domain-containing protein [Candidatus Babeliales bacterium]|nr:NYN domain-containing protein [Candidatus Babeliales bacterium]
MIIFVDGYNVIKHVSGESYSSELDKNKFLELMSNYAKKHGHEATVFFDGGSLNFAYTESYKFLKIVYSGYKLSADDVIKQYLQSQKGLKILLVTTDRELRNFATGLKFDSVKSVDFYKILTQKAELGSFEQKIASSGKIDRSIYKTTQDDNFNLDQIMQEASKKIQIKKDDYGKVDVDKNALRHKLRKP